MLVMKVRSAPVALTVRQRRPSESPLGNNGSCRAKCGLAVSALRPGKEKEETKQKTKQKHRLRELLWTPRPSPRHTQTH